MVIVLTGCASKVFIPVDYEPDLRKYDTAFPYSDVSRELERAFESIVRITVSASYNTYIFDPADEVTVEKLRQMGAESLSVSKASASNTKAGTATVIATSRRSIALLTCAHVVTMDDTLFTYAAHPQRYDLEVLASVSIRQRQNNLILERPLFGTFVVVASDSAKDLAILKTNLVNPGQTLPPVIRNKLGRPQDLVLGSFIYVLGYPQGYKMVQNGVVSEPNRDGRGGFISNALFNPGISGSPIFARRGAGERLELVGLARGAHALTEQILVPDSEVDQEYEDYLPYTGDVFVSSKHRINYGITHSISADDIRVFINRHIITLIGTGFDLSDLASDAHFIRRE